MQIKGCVATPKIRWSFWTEPSAFPFWISNIITFSKTFTEENITYHGEFFFHSTTAPSGQRPPHCRGLTIILRHTTLDKTPLDEWSAHRRAFWMTTQNTYKRQITPEEFEPEIPACERPQTHALDLAATGTVQHQIRQQKLQLHLLAWNLLLFVVVSCWNKITHCFCYAMHNIFTENMIKKCGIK